MVCLTLNTLSTKSKTDPLVTKTAKKQQKLKNLLKKATKEKSSIPLTMHVVLNKTAVGVSAKKNSRNELEKQGESDSRFVKTF